MAFDYATLSSEIANDPKGLGLPAMASAKNWAGIASALTTPSSAYSKSVPRVPIASVLIWAGPGPLDALSTGLASTSAAVRSICRACLLLFTLPSTTYLDLGDSRNTAMLAALVSAGVFSSADRDACLALATVSPATQAEQILGDGVMPTEGDCHIAATAPWGTF